MMHHKSNAGTISIAEFAMIVSVVQLLRSSTVDLFEQHSMIRALFVLAARLAFHGLQLLSSLDLSTKEGLKLSASNIICQKCLFSKDVQILVALMGLFLTVPTASSNVTSVSFSVRGVMDLDTARMRSVLSKLELKDRRFGIELEFSSIHC